MVAQEYLQRQDDRRDAQADGDRAAGERQRPPLDQVPGADHGDEEAGGEQHRELPPGESEQAHRCLRISGASPLVLVKRGRAAAPMARIATIPIWMYSTPAKARG